MVNGALMESVYSFLKIASKWISLDFAPPVLLLTFAYSKDSVYSSKSAAQGNILILVVSVWMLVKIVGVLTLQMANALLARL